MRMPPLRHILRRARGPLIYAAVCAVVALALRERAWEHLATLNGDEWQPIQTYLREHRQGEEPICFLPLWTVGHATDQYKFRGIDLLEAPEDAWEDRDEPLPGFWVVSQFGAFNPESVPEDRYPHRDHVTLGAAEVHLFRREEPADLPESLVTHLDETTCVLHESDEARLVLEWDRIGYSVPSSHPDSSRMGYLGCRVAESAFGGRHHTGIWFHPPPEGQSLSLTWPEAPLEPWLEVGGGVRDQVAGRSAPPVKLAVILDGRTLATLSFPSQRGWKTHAVPTGVEPDEDRTGRLSFKVWTTNNHSRHFIFDARFSQTRPAGRSPRRPRASGRSKRRSSRAARALSNRGGEETPDRENAESDAGDR